MLGALWSGGVLVYCSGHLDKEREPRGHKQPQQETGDPAHNMLIHLMFIYLVTRASLPTVSLSLSTVLFLGLHSIQ